MKLSKREKKLIYMLLLIAAIAAVVLVVQSVNVKTGEKETELATLQAQTTEMRAAIASLTTLRSNVPAVRSEIVELIGSLNKTMRNREIDRAITGYAEESGLSPVSLVIGDTAPASVTAYGAALAQGDSAAQSGTVNSAAVACTATGSYEQLYAFVNALNGSEGYRVTDFNVSKISGSSSLQISIGITVYMSGLTEEDVNGISNS